MKLKKCALPTILTGINVDTVHAYTEGLFTADGCHNKFTNHIDLYGEKIKLKPFISYEREHTYNEELDRQRVIVSIDFTKYEVPFKYDISGKLAWFAGLCDGDACVTTNKKFGSQTLQLCSTDNVFLHDTMLLLQTIGVSSKVRKCVSERTTVMPNGKHGSKLFNCKSAYRLLVSSGGIRQLTNLGIAFNRLSISKKIQQREAEGFVKVTKVTTIAEKSETFCCTEQKEHSIMVEGVISSQCNEIHLPTNDERTAVCCLSSLNLEYYDEWRNTNLVSDLVRMLDNVLSHFIKTAPEELKKAIYSATRERSIGLGAMGFHSFLQRNGVAFESAEAISKNEEIFIKIKKEAINESRKLAKERGEAPDMVGTGMRNSHLLAIAPNANSSIIADTSPSIEPISANAFVHRTRAGSYLVKNKYLTRVLTKKGKNTDEVWSDIIANDGSVQHLDFLSPVAKKLFRTAMEIDQMWVIKHAADRQKYICQGQSVNLFFHAKANRKDINKVHMEAWKQGLKGLYYLRTEASSKAENVGTKVERVALKEELSTASVEPPSQTCNIGQDECTSCMV
jgi:ribonucleoside-diphosphate reductase alpha chain